MINLKNTSNKFLVISYLVKVLAIFGCLLFVFSFIYPFYYDFFLTLAGGGSIYYWSYKIDYRSDVMMIEHSNQYWFSNYWFSSNFVGLGIPWVGILLFTIQVLTLVFGVASVILSERILSIVSVLSCLGVLGLMSYARQTLNGGGEYQLGYYFVYPSVILFASAFALNELLRKKRTTEPAKQNQNNLSS